MPDRVDPTVNGMQLRSLESPLDNTGTEAQVQELKTSHDPMLRLRQGRHRARQGTRAAFAPIVVLNAVRVGHRDDREASRRAGGARNEAKGAGEGGPSPPVPPLALIP